MPNAFKNTYIYCLKYGYLLDINIGPEFLAFTIPDSYLFERVTTLYYKRK